MSTPVRRPEEISALDLVPVEEYLALDDASLDARLEYAAGHVFALAGTTRRHTLIVRNLLLLLQAAVEGHGCDACATDLRLRVSRHLYFYPDVMVACGERAGSDRDETVPTLVAEVLSESTEHRDLGTKLVAYLSLPSLLAYLIVSQDRRRIEVHWRADPTASWRHEKVEGEGTVHLEILGGIDLPLERVYARTDVEPPPGIAEPPAEP